MDGVPRFRALALVATLLLSAGCAVRGPQTWRLVPQDRGQVLVPPRIAGPAVAQATWVAAAPLWRAPCAPAGNALVFQKRGKRVRVTVAREALLQQPAGWLAEWTASAEAQGCLPQGTGLEFAMRILDSVPLDPSAAYRLLHAANIAKGYEDLGLETRLQVVSPIMKEGADPDAPIVQIGPATGDDSHLNVTVEAPGAQYGTETAWYTFQPRADRNGARIVPVSAEDTIGGKTEPAAAPLTNYFQFSASAAFYRLYYKADLADNSITEIVIAAPTRAELDRRTERLIHDFSLCRQSDPEMCMVIPRRVAVNPFMMVTVNGVEVRLPWRGSVRNAVRAGGGPLQLQEILPHLAVYKPFAGKLTLVEFDRASPDIFNLVLLGGESISWK
ncbi:MAG: hypothetical protein ACLQU1_43985 [Bryobacteraceae bacterium]